VCVCVFVIGVAKWCVGPRQDNGAKNNNAVTTEFTNMTDANVCGNVEMYHIIIVTDSGRKHVVSVWHVPSVTLK
jgi:hypothetical protein